MIDLTKLTDKLREAYQKSENGIREVITESVTVLRNQEREIETLTSQVTLPEAGASATVKVVESKTKMQWLLTFRGHNPHSLAAELPDISQMLADVGLLAYDEYIRADNRQPQIAASAEVANGSLSFAADSLSISINDGKTYYKVKGGIFQQYGVTIWPEVLAAAGFSVDSLNPLDPPDISGYTAICETKEDGKPKKVIELRK